MVPFRSSKVNARIIGNVAEVAVEEGQSIEEGAMLARLDDSLQRAQYELAKFEAANDSAVKAAEVQLRKADLDLERVKKLGGTAAPMEFENATANRDFAAANLRMKEMELEQAKTDLKPCGGFPGTVPGPRAVQRRRRQEDNRGRRDDRRRWSGRSSEVIDMLQGLRHAVRAGDGRVEARGRLGGDRHRRLPARARRFRARSTFLAPAAEPGTRQYSASRCSSTTPKGGFAPGRRRK